YIWSNLGLSVLLRDTMVVSGIRTRIKRPGETVKISCKVSGFDMTSSYMHWIRQKPGKPLEWIGRMDAGSNSATYAESLKDQFIMTEDVSLSTQYLQAKSLRAEDTAVYYCAQETEAQYENSCAPQERLQFPAN
uniref:Ig-like domain-containing protein n=1 Tax=Denticeps clupeoides TaxID=299321 RepID=A0AAY4BS22_9TELE